MNKMLIVRGASSRHPHVLLAAGACMLVLLLASQAWRWASPASLLLLAAAGGGLLVLKKPQLGLIGLMLAALLANLKIGTGTEVNLNPATLLVPVLAAIWGMDMLRRRTIGAIPARANLPLVLFLALGLLSLLIGRATWDPAVPVGGNFLLVQLAQWAIFAFSALAFWLAANLMQDEAWLRRLTQAFLLVGGTLAILIAVFGVGAVVNRISTVAPYRAPFWILLTGLAGGQLLFDGELPARRRVLLVAILLAVAVFAFGLEREVVSNWVGVSATAAVLIWLRWPRLRWPLIVVVVILVVVGVFFPSLWEFAGGDQEWELSGASRVMLAQRVIGVTLRNPITGLGPAAYRPYANMTPLRYGSAYWIQPLINSHNNYVDIFAHTGLVGLCLFLWFMVEIAGLAKRLGRRSPRGFAASYANGMLATWAGIMVTMLLLDWFLPFVYNVGFEGFQASVLVWLFLGGLLVIENEGREDANKEGQRN